MGRDWSHRYLLVIYGMGPIGCIEQHMGLIITKLDMGSVLCLYESHAWDWSHRPPRDIHGTSRLNAVLEVPYMYLRDMHCMGPVPNIPDMHVWDQSHGSLRTIHGTT